MMCVVRAWVITALMLTVAISLIITVLATTGQQPTLYRSWTYSPISGVSEEYQVYRVAANGINYSRIIINIESVSGAPLSNASVTVYALTPYHIVPVGVYVGSRVAIPMNTPSIAYAVGRWVSWMLRSTWHSIQPGLYTALLVFITYQTPRGVYIKSFTIPYAPAPLYIGNETYVIMVNARINTTAPPNIPISQLKPAGPAVTKPLLELSNNTDKPGQLYDCMSQAPEYAPGSIASPAGFIALANCTGYNGTIPLLWISWGQNAYSELSRSEAQLYGEIYIQSSSSNQPFSLYSEELKMSNGLVIAYIAGVTFIPQTFNIGAPYLQWLGTFGVNFTGPGIYYLGVPGAYGMAQYQYWECNPGLSICTPTNQYYYYVVGLNTQNELINGIDTGNGPVTAILRFFNYYGLSSSTPVYVGCSVNDNGMLYFYFPNETSEKSIPYLTAEYVANIFNVPLIQAITSFTSAVKGNIIIDSIAESGSLSTWIQWFISIFLTLSQTMSTHHHYISPTYYYAVSVNLIRSNQYVYYNVIPSITYVSYNGRIYTMPIGIELNETRAGNQLAQGCPPKYHG